VSEARTRAVCLVAEPIHPAGIEHLQRSGVEVRFASNPALEQVPAELHDVDAIIVRNALPRAAIDAAPRLAVIANHGTGTDAVDVGHASERGVPVVNTPTGNVDAVAEHTIMLMLAVARKAVVADRATRRADTRFKYQQPTLSLAGKTLGVVGFGHTGQRVAALARGLRMRVVVWSPRADAERIEAFGAHVAASFDRLLAEADVLSLHRPLRPDTRHTLNRATLAQLKPTAIVINTSRGGLIDEEALADALEQGRLFGAGLDVLAVEPLPLASRLAALDNVTLSPHIAGSTEEALRETAVQCALQVVDVLHDRRPAALVVPDVWERRVRFIPRTSELENKA